MAPIRILKSDFKPTRIAGPKKEYLPVKYKPSYMSSKYDNVQKDIDKFNKKRENKKQRHELKHLLDHSPSKRIDLDKEIKKQRRYELKHLLDDSPSKRINLDKEVKINGTANYIIYC